MKVRPMPFARCFAAIAVVALSAACATSSSTSTTSVSMNAAPVMAVPATPLPNAMPIQNVAAPSPDPRVGLKAGWFDAGQAIWNMKVVSMTKPNPLFMNEKNPVDGNMKSSDLAFVGNIVYQGSYSGWQAWDVSDVKAPKSIQAYVCPGQQSDLSVYKNLLFVSHEAASGRVDCGLGGIQDTVSPDRARGVRILDISNPANPRRITMVQTCRGSHTHSLAVYPNDRENVYVFVSGTSGVRSPNELPGCSGGSLETNPNTASFRLEVIQVPLANPAAARIVNSPRVFTELGPAPGRGGGGGGRGGAAGRAAGAGAAGAAAGGAGAGAAGAGAAGAGGAGAGAAGAAAGGRGAGATAPARGGGGGRGGGGPPGCHDVTLYPELGLGGGACSGYGILMDIRDPRNVQRIAAVTDTNMSLWHSVTFSNDGKKILFSDEWGGGTGPRCREGDRLEWGANALFDIEPNNQLRLRGYIKMPAAQTEFENCTAHNGSLIPVPGRDIKVQSYYQGGISVFDWTDPSRAKEIAFFDRGPMDGTRLTAGGYWSAYYYNGHIYGSEEFRGLDIFELTPSPFLTQNEIDAAKSVKLEYFNPQGQPKLVWPPSFVVARAYIDQLARDGGVVRTRLTEIAGTLAGAETLSGQRRRDQLTRLAVALDRDAQSAADGAKVRMLATAVRELAAVR